MQYEFSPTENATIGKAAVWARVLGIVMFVQAAVNLLSDFNVIGAGINVVVGIFYLLGGLALKQVVDTSGRDVTLMIGALRKLGNAFLTRIIVMLIGVGLLITVGAILALVVAAS